MTEAIRAIIVDDERLARRELRSMLAAHPEIEVAGEADCVDAALQLIHDEEPDVVFLDIQMPGESGFDLLERAATSFQVIFVTAFDSHAIRAFEVNALDYLLKPINPDRLARAIARLSATGAAGELSPGEPSGQSSGKPASDRQVRKLEYDDHLFLSIDDRSRFVKISVIAAVCGAGDYSEILTTDGQKTLVLKPLKEWEERLPERHFLRIHRSTIINLEHVERIDKSWNQSHLVYLRKIAEPFAMSRRYAARLKLRFG